MLDILSCLSSLPLRLGEQSRQSLQTILISPSFIKLFTKQNLPFLNQFRCPIVSIFKPRPQAPTSGWQTQIFKRQTRFGQSHTYQDVYSDVQLQDQLEDTIAKFKLKLNIYTKISWWSVRPRVPHWLYVMSSILLIYVFKLIQMICLWICFESSSRVEEYGNANKIKIR